MGCTAPSSSQQLHVGHCTAPPSRGRTAVSCALPPVRRPAASRVRQLLHAAFSASTTQQDQDAVLRGKQALQGGSKQSACGLPIRHVEPHAQVSSPCSMVAAAISSGSGLQPATLSPGPAAPQYLTDRMLARCRLVQATVAFLQGHSLWANNFQTNLRQGTVCHCVAHCALS